MDAAVHFIFSSELLVFGVSRCPASVVSGRLCGSSVACEERYHVEGGGGGYGGGTQKTAKEKEAKEKLDKDVKGWIKKLIETASKPEVAGALESYEVATLLEAVKPIFQQQPMLVEVPVPLSICGDVHGQIADVVRLFDQNGWPGKMQYLFLGKSKFSLCFH